MTEEKNQKTTSFVPNRWFLINIAITLATALFTLLYYSHIPNRIQVATHYGWNSHTAVLANKNSLMLWLNPILQLCLNIIPIWMNWVLNLYIKYVLDDMVTDPRKNRSNRLILSKMSQFLFTLGLMLTIFFLFGQLFTVSLISSNLIDLFSIFMVVGMGMWLVLMIGSIFVTRKRTLKPQTPEEHKEAKHWKAGFIYYNRANPHVVVDDRAGAGVTFNMVHWQSWLYLGVIFLLPTILIVIAIWVSKN